MGQYLILIRLMNFLCRIAQDIIKDILALIDQVLSSFADFLCLKPGFLIGFNADSDAWRL